VQSYCAECGIEIKTKEVDEIMRIKLNSVFPYADFLYKRLKFVEEKRMFMELADMRSKLVHVRNRFIVFKNEKVAQIPKVKEAFYAYYDKCAAVSAAEREFRQAEKEYRALEKACKIYHEEVNRGRAPPSYDMLPSSKCCTNSLIECLSQSTTTGANNTITLYPELLSKENPPTCRECPSVLPILTHDERIELDSSIRSSTGSSKGFGGCVLLQSFLGGKASSSASESKWCPKQLFRSWFCKDSAL